jgi:hypothetical protein
MRLINQVIDFTDDVSKEIFKQASAIPEHCADGAILTAEERAKLAEEDFALVMLTKEASRLRKFPITDEANTWLSCHYFSKTAARLPHTAQKIAAANLKRACAIFNITPPNNVCELADETVSSNFYDEATHANADRSFEQTVKIARELPRSESSPHYYALSGKYAMPSAEYVKIASQYFDKHEKEFGNAEDRHSFANNVLNRAKELNVDLGESATINKYASDQYSDNISRQIKLRESLVDGKDDLSKSLSKLASFKSTTEPSVFAKALYEFDKKAGLERYYGKSVDDAFKATLEKTAASAYQWKDAQTNESITGDLLKKAASSKFDKISQYFGKTVAENLKKHPVEIFDSLPNDAKVVIVRLAKGTM